ncbi:MAG: hypothetical protein IT469_01760 [Pseudomonadales bacterium]|nr:hypothetical protein [Pseudomonadales bacterium]
MTRTAGPLPPHAAPAISLTRLQPAELKRRRFMFTRLPMHGGRLEIWEAPSPSLTYILGGDCALGMEGRDYDAAIVLAIGPGTTTPRQVAEVHGRWGETFDRVLYALCCYYGGHNGVFVCLERQVGLPIMRRLYNDYAYTWLYHERDETKAGRHILDKLGHPRVYDDFTLRNLRLAVLNRQLELRSHELIRQMRILQWFARGEEPGKTDRARDEQLKIRLPGGGSPDLVMAAAYAWHARMEVTHFERPKTEPYAPGTLGDIFGFNKEAAAKAPAAGHFGNTRLRRR